MHYTIEIKDLPAEELLAHSQAVSKNFGAWYIQYLDLLRETYGLWSSVDDADFPGTIPKQPLHR